MRISIEEKHSWLLVTRPENPSPISAPTPACPKVRSNMDQAVHCDHDRLRSCCQPAGVYQMKQKLQKLEKKIEILQKVNCTVSASLQEKAARALPNCMVSIVSMPYARRFVYPAVPSTTISSGEKG